MRIGFYAPCNEHNRQTGPLLGIAYMAAYLRTQLGIEDIFMEVDAQRAMSRRPDVLAISSFSEKYGQVSREVATIRREHPDLPIILGGPHISALPQSLSQHIDVGVIGEGEKPMLAMIQLLLDQGALRADSLKEIKNLIYWDEDRHLQRTVFEDRIDDLDSLPLPQRDLMQAWWPSLDQKVVFDRGVYTARGCSFKCHFCMFSERANLIRYVSIDTVMEDIAVILRDYPEQKHIIFYDDLFVTKKSRLKELADAIRAEGYHKRVTFGCMAKTSFFDKEYAQILKDMNIRMVSWGFESGSNTVLQYLKDRHSTVYKHQQAIDLAHQYGLLSGGYFIVGAPPETLTDLAKTYWFIHQNRDRIPLVGIYPVIPLPGTGLWTETAARGLIDDQYSEWQNMGFLGLEDTYLHINQHYSKTELKSAYDTHFSRLIQWTNYIFPRLQQRFSQNKPYFKAIFSDIRDQFPSGSRLLELHRADRVLSYELESEYDLLELHWSELERLQAVQADDFDAIIVTHALEKFGFDSPHWQALLALKLPIYLICEQIGHVSYLLGLLQGKFPAPLESSDIYSMPYRYTLSTLKAGLSQFPLTLQSIQRYYLTSPESENEKMREILHFLQDHLPVQDYLKESTVFSYGLLLQP